MILHIYHHLFPSSPKISHRLVSGAIVTSHQFSFFAVVSIPSLSDHFSTSQHHPMDFLAFSSLFVISFIHFLKYVLSYTSKISGLLKGFPLTLTILRCIACSVPINNRSSPCNIITFPFLVKK